MGSQNKPKQNILVAQTIGVQYSQREVSKGGRGGSLEVEEGRQRVGGGAISSSWSGMFRAMEDSFRLDVFAPEKSPFNKSKIALQRRIHLRNGLCASTRAA